MEITPYFCERGSGTPLLLLHGNGENSDYFAHQMAPFSKQYRVIAPDTRGHGRTARGDAPFTIDQFATDLAALLDQLGIAQAHLLGFSDGANIAMCFALRFPQRIKKLVLNGGNLTPDGIKRRVQLPIELGYWLSSRFAAKHAGARRNAELLGLMVRAPGPTAADLAKITAETLVIAGTRDLVKQSHTEQIAAALPHGKLVLLPGNHFLARQNPEAFNEAVLDFLAD